MRIKTEKETFSPLRLLLKTLLLFGMINLAFALVNPLPVVGRLSAYNWLYPGRFRLPYGERPDLAYNLSLYNLDGMFASHEISRPKAPDEFRVIMVGDSATWGYLLKPQETLSAQLNLRGLTTATGKQLTVYNLGYPTISLIKDLLILERALAYQPDLIIWRTTLEAFPRSKQLDSPIVQNNAPAIRQLIEHYALDLDPADSSFFTPNIWQQTLVGQRRALADLIRLQMLGILWSATGIDQYYPPEYDPPLNDLPSDETFHELQPPRLNASDLAFDVMEAGDEISGQVPILLLNEPVFRSSGQNNDIRYNFFYPRWAYDQYRQLVVQFTQSVGWYYLDAWDWVPASEFTNSAIHLSADGETLLADRLVPVLEELLADLKE